MRLRLALLSAVVSCWFSCQCGGKATVCELTHCGPGLVCNPSTGKCDSTGTGGGTGGGTAGSDGGADAGVCPFTCSGATPECDAANQRCVTCTVAQGCSGLTPICDPSSNGGFGRCVACTITSGCTGNTPYCDPTVPPAGACSQCRGNNDCIPGTVCDSNTRTCVIDDGGQGGGAGGGGGGVVFDDGGQTARCFPIDAGSMSCTNECPRGFSCVAGLCQLNGHGGPIQVTLRFNQPEDLDLHVVEPVSDGGTCEIWYGNTNFDAGPPPIPLPFPLPMPARCGAYGWLDLDSNPACRIDNVDVENVIYPHGITPHSGTYIVRVDYYQDCQASGPIPYEVEVRANGTTRFYCGQFQPGTSNGGNAGSGVTIGQFTIP